MAPNQSAGRNNHVGTIFSAGINEQKGLGSGNEANTNPVNQEGF